MSNYITGYTRTMKTAGIEKRSAGFLHRNIDQILGAFGSERLQHSWRQLRHKDGIPHPDIHKWKRVPEAPTPDGSTRRQVAADNTWNDWNDWLDPAQRGSDRERLRAAKNTLIHGVDT